eukprot:jgi/Botrbrau1/7281/Bobra.0318s0018.1
MSWDYSAKVRGAVVAVCFFCSLAKEGDARAMQFVIIDAGSTGSRIHIYHGMSVLGGLPMIIHPHPQLKQEPGLASYSERPQDAGQSLDPLINFAVSQVPQDALSATPIFLLATAGLRLLQATAADALLASCRKALASSPFAFNPGWVRVIDGSEEGIFAWLAANHATGALSHAATGRALGRRALPAEHYFGVFELGGASMQVTFHVSDPAAALHPDVKLLRLPNLGVAVYTHSFLGYGQEAAQAETLALALSSGLLKDKPSAEQGLGRGQVVDPCLPRGYSGKHPRQASMNVTGGGMFSTCRNMASSLIRRGIKLCTALLHCSSGEALPLAFSGHWIALENFHHTASFLGLAREPTLSEVVQAGERHCASPFHSLQAAHPVGRSDLLRYCFGAAYIVALLHDGFGVGMEDRQIAYTGKVQSPEGVEISLDWTLGAAVMQMTGPHNRNSLRHGFSLRKPLGGWPAFFLMLVASLAAALLLYLRITRWEAWDFLMKPKGSSSPSGRRHLVKARVSGIDIGAVPSEVVGRRDPFLGGGGNGLVDPHGGKT